MLNKLSDKYNRLRGKKNQIQEDFKRTRKGQKAFKRKAELYEKALAVSQEVAKQTQEELEYRVSDIVTTALSAVFPEPYVFKIIFEIKRGKTEARLVFTRDGEEIDPMTAAGGGVIDVASFALRLSCYLIMIPRPEPVMILDEPFRFVSKEYQEKVADLLEELADKLGIQFIIVTHEEELERGNIISWGK